MSMAGIGVGVSMASGGGGGSLMNDDVWEDEDNEGITDGQRIMRKAVESPAFKTATTCVILVNTAIIVFEADRGALCEGPEAPADCDEPVVFVRVCNLIFLAVYTIEMAIRIFVFRRSYFSSAPDLFDAGIVIIGIIGEILGGAVPGIAILRLFRVARVSRSLRVFGQFDELKVFISGMNSAAKAIMWGSFLILCCVFVWGIVAVMVIHPLNQKLTEKGVHAASGCDRCERSYESVAESMLTILQTVVMGDSWGEFTVAIIEESPWAAIVFIAMSFSTSLCLTNLILAVIIDKALGDREVNLKKQALAHQHMLEGARVHYTFLCKKIDNDKSGTLTREELMLGFDHPEFQPVLQLLDITKEDMGCVFDMMDKDGSGEVSYEEFSYQLQNLKTQDMHTMISFIKFYVMELHNNLESVKQKQNIIHGQASPSPQALAPKASPAFGGSAGTAQVQAEAPTEKADIDPYALKTADAPLAPQTLQPGIRDPADAVEACSRAVMPPSGPGSLQEVHLALGNQLQDLHRFLEDQVASIRIGLFQDVDSSSAKCVQSASTGRLARGAAPALPTYRVPGPLAKVEERPIHGAMPPDQLAAGGRRWPVAVASSTGGRQEPYAPGEIVEATGMFEPRLSIEGPKLLRPAPAWNNVETRSL